MINQETVAQDIKEKVQNQYLKYPIHNNWLVLSVMILCLMCFILDFVLNVTIEIPFFLDGINFIYNYQQNQPSSVFKVIHNLISLFGTPYAVAVFLVLYYIPTKRKLTTLVHLTYYFYATFIMALIVQGLQGSRPIWYDLRIKNLQWQCMTSFGNPSGHCFTTAILYEPFISDITGYKKYKILAIPLAILVAVINLSRTYLGVHSANQVLFGTTLGFIALIFYKYIYQKQIFELLWQLLTSIKKNLKIIAILIMHFFTIVIPLIIFLVNFHHRPLFQRDLDNINIQCNTNDITSQSVQSGMFVTGCSIGSLPFGFLYGFLLLMNRNKYRKYFLGRWRYQGLFKFIINLLIYIIGAGFPYLFFFVISTFAVKDIPVINYLLSSAGALGVGFGLTFFVPILSIKWKVIQIDQKIQTKDQQIKGAQEN